MRGGLWQTTVWVWDLAAMPGGVEGLIGRMAAVPGQKGVIIKAGDGRYDWDQWESGMVGRLRAAGIGVGLWTFCYGSGPANYGGVLERPGVAAELATLQRAVRRAEPDCIVLNIEDQIMAGQSPAREVEQLVAGATRMVGAVGVSTVWHWADTMRWPFAAAVNGGLAYWSNQVYAPNWPSWWDYRRLYDTHSGGKPDYISLNGYDGGQDAAETRRAWSASVGAPGVAWWSAQHLDDARWAGIAPPPVTGDGWDVGEGLRAAMAAAGDEPVSNELYYPSDGRGQWSLAGGRRWLWGYLETPEAGHIYQLGERAEG